MASSHEAELSAIAWTRTTPKACLKANKARRRVLSLVSVRAHSIPEPAYELIMIV